MPTIPSEGASKLKSAGSSRSRHNLVKVHLGLTLMLNSTYAMMMICLSNDVSLNPGPTVTQSTNLPTIRGFKISHLNVRSITHKMDSIRLLLKDNYTLDVFTVSETWLSPKVTDTEITIPGYSVVGKDRNSRGGVVAMFIRDGIPFKTRMDRTDNNTNFVNNSHRVVGSGVVPLAISDHSLIYGIFKSGVPKAPPRIVEHRTYKKYNKSAFIKDINELSWSIIDDRDVDSGVNLWSTLFSKVANSHAPIKKTRIKGIAAPWMTSELSQLMHDRNYHHTKAVKSNSKYHWARYRKLKQVVKKRVKECKASYYKDLIEKNSGNPGELWRTLNEITSRKNVSALGKILPSASKQNAQSNDFSFTPVSESFVFKLKTLKTNKAIGLDKISSRLLKDSAESIAPVLTRLFNRSLDSSVFPAIWKQGKVTALFKSGDKSDCNNYRPITVLPTVSKILERAVHQQLYGYLTESNLLTTKQFGFRPKLSTEVALAHFTDRVLEVP